MSTLASFLACFTASLASAGDFSVTASLDGKEIRVGRKHEIIVEIDSDEPIVVGPPSTAGTARGGLREPVLQLEVPPCVKLLGRAPKRLRTPNDFQESFLQKPYGRLLAAKKTTVKFKLKSAPDPNDVIALNFTTFLDEHDKTAARFVRKRLELPLVAGARAKVAKPTRSHWGSSDSVAIGETLPDLILPQPDGSPVALNDFRAHSNMLLVIYRRDT